MICVPSLPPEPAATFPAGVPAEEDAKRSGQGSSIVRYGLTQCSKASPLSAPPGVASLSRMETKLIVVGGAGKLGRLLVNALVARGAS